MTTERGGYPYVEGSHGIPFSKIDKSASQGIIISGSGKELFYMFDERFVSVLDIDAGLFAVVVNGELTMSLRTREETGRHPDLFAGKFVDYAFEYFGSRGVAIERFHSFWNSSSDNMLQFVETYERTGDSVQAANGTWSGKAMARHGFSVGSPDDVSMYSSENNLKPKVEAIFRRTS